jgi:hypothetical protein
MKNWSMCPASWSVSSGFSGNAYKALEALRFLEMDLEMFENEDEVTAKLYKHVQEFAIYIHNNRNYIPSYGDWWSRQS